MKRDPRLAVFWGDLVGSLYFPARNGAVTETFWLDLLDNNLVKLKPNPEGQRESPTVNGSLARSLAANNFKVSEWVAGQEWLARISHCLKHLPGHCIGEEAARNSVHGFWIICHGVL